MGTSQKVACGKEWIKFVDFSRQDGFTTLPVCLRCHCNAVLGHVSLIVMDQADGY
jgi:hypothetical protein